MKKTTMRKTLLASFIVAFSVCMGASTMCLSAGAEETAVTVDTATVTMAKGASARISEDGHNGLRYTMEMSADDYKGLKKTYGADIKFGILIAPASYTAMTEETVFGESAIYDWATYNEETEEWVYTGENGANGSKKRIINLTSAGMKADVNDASKYVMYGTIADMNETNFAREFAGVGYIEYTVDGVTDYKFLAGNDNTRSMAYVAQVYQTLDDSVVSAADKALVKATYITGKADQVDTFYTVNHMLSDGNGNYTVGETEKVTAKINGETVAPTAKTFDGYCYDASNANNSAGGDLVYADGKTAALNIYYTNDWNKDFVKNADGSYSMTTAGRSWKGGPSWAYTYTTETPATTAVYSVKMEASSAFAAPAWSIASTGIIVSQGERVADEDTTFYEWIDLNSSQRSIPKNSIYGTVFGASTYDNYDVTLVTNRGMGYCYGLGNGSAPKMSDTKNELTMTLVLYDNVFYVYIDDTLIGARSVSDNGDWNGLVAFKVPSGNKYGYDNNVGFRFGMGSYNNSTDVKFTVVTEKYDEEALAILSNYLYKVEATTETGYGYKLNESQSSDTIVYSVNVLATSSYGFAAPWNAMGHVGIAIASASNMTNVVTMGYSQQGLNLSPNARRLDVDGKWDTAVNSDLAFKTAGNVGTHTKGVLTIVIYNKTLYIYAGAGTNAETFIRSIALAAGNGYINDGCIAADGKYVVGFGTWANYHPGNSNNASVGVDPNNLGIYEFERTRLYGEDALAELASNPLYANIGVTA